MSFQNKSQSNKFYRCYYLIFVRNLSVILAAEFMVDRIDQSFLEKSSGILRLLGEIKRFTFNVIRLPWVIII